MSSNTPLIHVRINGEKKAISNELSLDGLLRELLIPKERWPKDADVLRQAISSVKSIAPKTDGRIQRLDKVQGQKSDCS